MNVDAAPAPTSADGEQPTNSSASSLTRVAATSTAARTEGLSSSP